MTWNKLLLTTLALPVALCMTQIACGDSIQMKNSASVASNASVITIRDVADLNGAEALRFGDIAVANVDKTTNTLRITVEEVRAALNDAGAHWGRIDLNGWRTTVRVSSTLADAPQAMTGVAIDAAGKLLNNANDDAAPEQVQLLASHAMETNTIVCAIAKELIKQHGVSAGNLRMTFDAQNRAFLEQSTDTMRVNLQPARSNDIKISAFDVHIVKHGVVVDSQIVAIQVELKINSAISTKDLRRGAILTSNDVQSQETWIAAFDAKHILSSSAAIDRIAKRNIKQGELLRESELERQTVIARGELTKVRCLVGGVSITMEAEAKSAGSVGDTIEFRKPGERDTFLARVTGPNEAVVDLARR